MVVFGLVLHLSNINELENKKIIDDKWKQKNSGCSILFIIIFAAFLMFAYLRETLNLIGVNEQSMKIIAGIMCFASFLISYSIFYRLNKIDNA